MTHGTCSHSGKRRFTSIIDAANELLVCEKKREEEGLAHRQEQRIYWCKHCDAHHLTSKAKHVA